MIFIEKIRAETRAFLGTTPPREGVESLEKDLILICLQAQRKVRELNFPEDEAALLEHQIIQGKVGEQAGILSQKSGLTIRELRIAAAVTRRDLTKLGDLPDSVVLNH